MRLPRDIRKALSSNINDMLSWIKLLNFFSEHENELIQRQKQRIYYKCEEMRKYWNKERTHTEEVIRPMGEVIKVKIVNSPLNIRQLDIKPDNLYKTKILDNTFKYYFRQFIRQLNFQFTKTTLF